MCSLCSADGGGDDRVVMMVGDTRTSLLLCFGAPSFDSSWYRTLVSFNTLFKYSCQQFHSRESVDEPFIYISYIFGSLI